MVAHMFDNALNFLPNPGFPGPGFLKSWQAVWGQAKAWELKEKKDIFIQRLFWETNCMFLYVPIL